MSEPLITKEEVQQVETHEHIQTIAEYINDKKPDAVWRRVKLLLIGITVGIVLCGLVVVANLYFTHKPAKYITYLTFYIEEKGGVRPASLQYPGTIETTADLEAVELMLMRKYDNGKIINIILFGTPIVLRKVEEPSL